MKLVTDADGKPVLDGGNPVFEHSDGRKAAVNVGELFSKYNALSGDLDGLRNRAVKAEEALKGLGAAPEEISQALETFKNLKANKLVEAGKVDEAIATRLAEATSAWTAKEADYKSKVEAAEKRIYNLLVSQRFASSKALDDTFLTPDLAEAYWGKQFKVDGERVIGHYPNGQPIYSAAKPGEPADFDEALGILKASHPNKDKWTKSSNASGSGAPGSNGNGSGAKVMPRSQFSALPPGEQVQRMREGYQLSD
jgi:hypothetical protein